MKEPTLQELEQLSVQDLWMFLSRQEAEYERGVIDLGQLRRWVRIIRHEIDERLDKVLIRHNGTKH